jgi:hypothetical protein
MSVGIVHVTRTDRARMRLIEEHVSANLQMSTFDRLARPTWPPRHERKRPAQTRTGALARRSAAGKGEIATPPVAGAKLVQRPSVSRVMRNASGRLVLRRGRGLADLADDLGPWER